MRQAFLNTLTELAEQDKSVMLLTADTGFHVFDEFQQSYPDNYLNVGISEAAMIGMAAGLAIEGKRVFVYGIAPFVTLRCLEQIRLDLCCQNLPVKIVGVGAGLTYGPAGPSHHTIEDIAVMRSLPNMTVICPGDPLETVAAVRLSMDLSGPCYLRLGKSGEPIIHPNGSELSIEKGIRVQEGNDLVIITTGNMLGTAVEVCRLLDGQGIAPELLSLPMIKPIDKEAIIELAGKFNTLVTIEEHSVIGGLGAAVGDVLSTEYLSTQQIRLGIPDQYAEPGGSQEYLRRSFGLAPDQIADKILTALRG